MFVDKTLTCKECGAEFVFEAGEQEWYAAPERNFSDPQKCKPCREKARAAKFKNRDNFRSNDNFKNNEGN